MRRAELDEGEAVRLYVEEAWSALRIATKMGVAPATVRQRLVDHGVRLRTHAESHRPTGLVTAPPPGPERAWMLGFAAGDLYVRQPNAGGTTLEAGTNTTHAEQVALMEATFGRYGPVSCSGASCRVTLDRSFGFLLQKYDRVVPRWVRGRAREASFVAGYVDAEGSFGVYDGRARFKLDACDAEVLSWIHEWCQAVGIDARLRRIAAAGDHRPGCRPWPLDLWRITVNRAPAIERLVATLDPYLQHQRRRDAAGRARLNVQERLARRALRPESLSQPVGGGARRPREVDPR